jgi:hypothetical protein
MGDENGPKPASSGRVLLCALLMTGAALLLAGNAIASPSSTSAVFLIAAMSTGFFAVRFWQQFFAILGK